MKHMWGHIEGPKEQASKKDWLIVTASTAMEVAAYNTLAVSVRWAVWMRLIPDPLPSSVMKFGSSPCSSIFSAFLDCPDRTRSRNFLRLDLAAIFTTWRSVRPSLPPKSRLMCRNYKHTHKHRRERKGGRVKHFLLLHHTQHTVGTSHSHSPACTKGG